MRPGSDIVYEPSPRLRMLPLAIVLSVQMAIGTFFVAYYNFNGLRYPAGYRPTIFFLVLGAIFFWMYWRGNLRITLAETELVVERLFGKAHVIKKISYAQVAKVVERKISLRLELLSRDDRVLFVIPTNITMARGGFVLPDDPVEPAPDTGILWERYKLREEILRRRDQC